jgi:hypothetical protein
LTGLFSTFLRLGSVNKTGAAEQSFSILSGLFSKRPVKDRIVSRLARNLGGLLRKKGELFQSFGGRKYE